MAHGRAGFAILRERAEPELEAALVLAGCESDHAASRVEQRRYETLLRGHGLLHACDGSLRGAQLPHGRFALAAPGTRHHQACGEAVLLDQGIGAIETCD